MDLSSLPTYSKDGDVHAVIEIPKGSEHKYEYDKELGVMTLDRVLDASVRYPTAYGFVPRARSSDGELLDIMVMQRSPTFPGVLLRARLIGVLTISHTSGLAEEKLLGVVVGDPFYADYRDISDVPEFLLKEIEHFFNVYKDLEGSDIGVHGWKGAGEARRVLEAALEAADREGLPGSSA
jgi:inorganic pyrophosphatase